MSLDVKFVVVGGETKTTEVKLRLPTIIGRGRSSGIMVQHALVSRQHCEVYEADGRLMVRDLGSLNGTFVGQERITDCPLLPEQLLTVGNVTFRAVYELSPEAAALPVPDSKSKDTPVGGVVIDTKPTAPATQKTVPVPNKVAAPSPSKVASAAPSKATPVVAPAVAAPAAASASKSGHIEIEEPAGDEDDSSADFAQFLKSLEGGK